MTAEIVNLRRLRKAKAKTDLAGKASANRALFGRTRAERDNQALDIARATSHFEGHRREGVTDTGDGDDG